MRNEYRVWKDTGRENQGGTQGHYVLANSRQDAMKSVAKSKGPGNYNAMLWKKVHGKGPSMTRTKQALKFTKDGKPPYKPVRMKEMRPAGTKKWYDYF